MLLLLPALFFHVCFKLSQEIVCLVSVWDMLTRILFQNHYSITRRIGNKKHALSVRIRLKIYAKELVNGGSIFEVNKLIEHINHYLACKGHRLTTQTPEGR